LPTYDFESDAILGAAAEAEEVALYSLGMPGPEERDGYLISKELAIAAACPVDFSTPFSFELGPPREQPAVVPNAFGKRPRALSSTSAQTPSSKKKKKLKSRFKTPERLAKEKAQRGANQKARRNAVRPSTFRLSAVAIRAQCAEIVVEVDSASLKASQGGYECSRLPRSFRIPPEELTLEGLEKKPGFQIYKWNGVDPVMVLDQHRRPLACLDGRPALPPPGKPDRWTDEVITPAYELMRNIASRLSLSSSKSSRGPYAALAAGLSHGGGRGAPGSMHNGSAELDLAAQELRNAPVFDRIARFVSSRVANYAPNMYRYAAAVTDAVIAHAASKGIQLSRSFPGSIFPASTWNLPPCAVTEPHRDAANTPCFHCAITALGNFNADKSAYLVLYELGLAVRFPSGSTIRICSGNTTHYNTATEEGESRASFTNYMAGGLGRYVAYGFKNEADLTDAERTFHMSNLANAWKQSLSLFSTPESLANDRAPLMSRRG
jgi:hypothetical protein